MLFFNKISIIKKITCNFRMVRNTYYCFQEIVQRTEITLNKTKIISLNFFSPFYVNI